jgi:murein DD-endopeptidase MepM/ murein hydrolase activator NlpD
MNIILVSDDLAKTHHLRVSARQLCFVAAALAAILLAIGSGVEALRARREPAVIAKPATLAQHEAVPSIAGSAMGEALQALAARIGEMRARLTRLEAFGERLARVAGVRAQEIRFGDGSARGGPWLPAASHGALDLHGQIDELAAQIDDRLDKLTVLDQILLDTRVRNESVPNAPPVAAGEFSSGFGRRIDPFTRAPAFHAGIDFTADRGTDILAAASGVVITAQYQHEYGRTIEIDHGEGLTTRYAHASKLKVEAGQIVRKGQKIGEVGNTGRSTGAHLHFEVRSHGVAVDPNKYLRGG